MTARFRTEEEYDNFVDTILKGKFFAAQAAAKAIRKRGGGAVAIDQVSRYTAGTDSSRITPLSTQIIYGFTGVSLNNTMFPLYCTADQELDLRNVRL